jgi:predicted carbohydrate-binding protein with CBM5 and CBM33 domain
MDGRNRCRNHHRINVFSSSDLKHLVFAVLISLVLLVGVVERTNAHGRLEEPAARNCAWRFGYKTPENYNDNELNCGGVGQQWTTNG